MRCQEIMTKSPGDLLDGGVHLHGGTLGDDADGDVSATRRKKPVGVISLQDLARSDSEGEIGQTVREVKEEGARVY